jgi:hypothetical protein
VAVVVATVLILIIIIIIIINVKDIGKYSFQVFEIKTASKLSKKHTSRQTRQ